MNKIFLSVLIAMIAITQSNAQTKLGYYKEAQGGFIYTNYKADIDDSDDQKISGLGLDIRINYSLLGNLIFRDPEKKFFLGDHLGAGFGMGYFKKPDDKFPFMLSINLEYGLKTAYIVNDDIEVGLKWIAGGGNYFTDLKNDFTLVQKSVFVPAVRFKNLMGSVGFGNARTGSGTNGGKGNYVMAEGRIIFGDMSDESKGSIFLRLENYGGKYDETTRKDNATQVSLGFAFM
jgi:hypothetical protein